MRATLIILAVAMAALSLEGCKEKRDNGDIITQKVVKKKPAGPMAMQKYTQRKDIDWNGSNMVCEIRREPDDSLQMVTDETGQKHIDNRITLTISRSDGSVFFKKTFTKASFDSYIDDDYRKTGILEGLVFDKVDGSRLRFAASVSHPQTDEYIPLVVDISRQGTIAVARDTQLDTNGNDDGGDEN